MLLKSPSSAPIDDGSDTGVLAASTQMLAYGDEGCVVVAQSRGGRSPSPS